MLQKFSVLMLVLSLLVFSCGNKDEEKAEKTNPHTNMNMDMMPAANNHKVVVDEVLQANSYTYLRVTEGQQNYWMAITKRDINVGDTYYYAGRMEMKNFQSKDLDRVFELVYFVQDVSKEPVMPKMSAAQSPAPQMRKEAVKEHVDIEHLKGGVTVADLYADKNDYVNKRVKIRGKVTKYNANIMGRNWVHLQDGTGNDKNFDITLTTNDNVSLGDVVAFEGRVSLERDFGAGYAYEVILEDATLLKQ